MEQRILLRLAAAPAAVQWHEVDLNGNLMDALREFQRATWAVAVHEGPACGGTTTFGEQAAPAGEREALFQLLRHAHHAGVRRLTIYCDCKAVIVRHGRVCGGHVQGTVEAMWRSIKGLTPDAATMGLATRRRAFNGCSGQGTQSEGGRQGFGAPGGGPCWRRGGLAASCCSGRLEPQDGRKADGGNQGFAFQMVRAHGGGVLCSRGRTFPAGATRTGWRAASIKDGLGRRFSFILMVAFNQISDFRPTHWCDPVATQNGDPLQSSSITSPAPEDN
ncbi:unnamed protein product [Symbiodinium natans]|uniref:Uncharacterized protein n=1 Tax=Symbiodinium natans TaxID=878477 RepID=A0A812QC32_9DINO|nr:unnamed protein product [Symbiodinium natans]